MKTHVERFVVIALGLAFACRPSGPPSNDISSEAARALRASLAPLWEQRPNG
jgi:hypothetical protein